VALGHRAHLSRWAPAFEELLVEAVELPLVDRVRAVAILARVSAQAGRYEEALFRCRAIAEESLAHCDLPSAAGLLFQQFDALARLGRYGEAEAVAARILERARREGDQALEGNASGQLANLFKMRGRFQEALRLYARAARLHSQAGDFVGVVRDYLNRAWLLNRMGLLTDARGAFKEAWRRAREIGHEVLGLRAGIGLGLIALREGAWEEARRRLLGCWREARRQGRPREEALALEFLAETSTLAGRLAVARCALSLCRRLAQRLAPEGDITVEAGIRSALLALASEDLERAWKEAMEAVALARRRGLRWESAQGLRLAGVVAARSGRPAEARRLFQEAHELFGEMGEGFEIHLVRRWLAHLGSNKVTDSLPFPQSRWLWHPVWAPVSDPEAGGVAECPHGEVPPRPCEMETRDLDPVWERVGLVTRSPKLARILREAEELARTGTQVLITGETGSGKELLARGMHLLSGRRGRFVPFNCAACPAELVESELFGVERGAYTGADRSRRGLIVEAADGTLFLDEVADLEPRAQGSLLRFLDTGEVRPLGSTRYVQVRLGVLSATHRSLEEWVREGRFREDLYYRLCGAHLHLPALRERLEDLELLLRVLWKRYAPGRPIPRWLLSELVLASLRSCSWRGNVRQLAHFVRRAAGWHGRDPDQFVAEFLPRLTCLGPRTRPTREVVVAALKETGGCRTRAAELLGISRSRLYHLMDRYGLR
jgi:tetratricopeptide (TPR) repeat protein